LFGVWHGKRREVLGISLYRAKLTYRIVGMQTMCRESIGIVSHEGYTAIKRHDYIRHVGRCDSEGATSGNAKTPSTHGPRYCTWA
jgi:hypothetical protein